MTALQTITINKQDLAVKEYNGQRVVTFKEIDRVHNRPEGTAGRAFRTNHEHFKEGTDYFSIAPPKFQSDEIRRFGILSPKGGYLLTESGYLMLVKSFGDKLAWDVQRKLVDTYFHKQPEQLTMEDTSVEEYRYIEKHFRGKQVITLRDFEHFTGITKSAAFHHIKSRKRLFRVREDYWVLQDLELAEFKAENPCAVNPIVPRLCILTESGCRKLMKLIQNAPKSLECFKPALPVPKQKESESVIQQEEVVVWADGAAATKRLRRLNELLVSAQSVLKLLNTARTENQHFSYLNTLAKLTMDAYVLTCNVAPQLDITTEFRQ